jgi:hypothetical protein
MKKQIRSLQLFLFTLVLSLPSFAQKPTFTKDGDSARTSIKAQTFKSNQDKETKEQQERKKQSEENEKAVRQQDGLLFQGRIVPTEFRKDHQNFLAKSYWAAKGSVKEFLDNKCFCFQ